MAILRPPLIRLEAQKAISTLGNLFSIFSMNFTSADTPLNTRSNKNFNYCAVCTFISHAQYMHDFIIAVIQYKVGHQRNQTFAKNGKIYMLISQTFSQNLTHLSCNFCAFFSQNFFSHEIIFQIFVGRGDYCKKIAFFPFLSPR